jgi:UDP:flavonoid glycosyltransferase YjiC (YdhE family)
MSALGREFLQRGWRVSAIVPARSPGRRMLEPLGVEVLDAPEYATPPHSFPVSINYAANLLRNGYWHGPTLARRLTGWRGLLDRLKPDLLVADHAPAALLVSRRMDCAVAAIGNGFTLPPMHSPMPCLQPWFPFSEGRLADVEHRFLATLNPILEDMGISLLSKVSSLYDGVERLLCIEPELDHYSIRKEENYLDAIEPEAGLPTAPIESEESPVFVYLSAHNRFLNSVLSALRIRKIPTIAYISGTTGLAETELPGSSIRFLNRLIDLRKLAAHCRLAIIHGGTLSTSLFLKHATKVLICPHDLEKALLAHRLMERDLAWATNWFSVDDDQPEAKLDTILELPPPSGLATFAARYRERKPGTNVPQIVDRLEQLVVGDAL